VTPANATPAELATIAHKERLAAINGNRLAVKARIKELKELCQAQVNAWAAERRLNELIREVRGGNLGLPALWQVIDPTNSITPANDYSYPQYQPCLYEQRAPQTRDLKEYHRKSIKEAIEWFYNAENKEREN